MASNVSARVIDNGLAVLDTEPDRLFICSAEPADYPAASGALRLGQKTFAAGAFFGAPQAGTADGRKVSSIAFADGLVTATGTATHWAVCDSVNSRLLATGTLAAPTAVTNTAAFGLPSFSIQVSVSIGAAISVVAVSLTATPIATASPALALPPLNPPVGWRTMKIGAGGFLSGIDITPNGSVVVSRTDTFGGYAYESGTNTNRQLITASGIAAGARAMLEDCGVGIVEVRLAPSVPTRFYMMYMGDVWRSNDSGVTWTATGLNYDVVGDTGSNNGPQRLFGQKMAVDPINADIVFVGSYNNGVWFTLNGGTSWAQISLATIPACSTSIAGSGGASDYPGHPGICFGIDTSGGRTQTIYVPVYGTGVYRTTNAGTSWSNITSGGPLKVQHAKVGINGVYYAVNRAAVEAGNPTIGVYKYTGSSWVNISPPTDIMTVVCDPSNANRVLAVGGGGHTYRSDNAGSAWSAFLTPTRVSPDIPWLAWTDESYFSASDLQMDTAGNLWIAQGIGFWKSTDFVGGASPSTLTYTSKSKGIENLSTSRVVTALGAKPLCCGWDRSIFIIADPEVYASTHTPNNGFNMAWDADYAVTDNTFIVYPGIWFTADQWVWKSTNSGVTWTAITSPSGGTIPLRSGTTPLKIGGCIAAATPLNFIVVPSGHALPWYTKDGGSTWAEIILSGMPTSGETGYGGAYYSPFRAVAADKVNVGTFYLYNWRRTGDGYSAYTGTQSLWRSTNSGDSWTKMNSANIDTAAVFYNVKLIAVEGKAGHLFLSGGAQGVAGDISAGTTKLSFSSNAGATWVALPNIAEPHSVCVGKAATGNDYPSVYFAGYLSGVWGIYQSDNTASVWTSSPASVTWTKIGDYPTDWPVDVHDLGASHDEYGLIYVGRAAAGYAYRRL